jgi:glutaredoxin-like protein
MISLTLKDLKSLEHTLSKLQDDVTIVYFTDEVNCRHCRREHQLLEELVTLSHKLRLEAYNFTVDRSVADRYGIDKMPGLALVGKHNCGVRYYGMPSDFEFGMLLEDILRLSSGESGLSFETKEKVKSLDVPLHLEVLTTSACHLSSGAVRVAHQMAMESEMITADLVNVEDFPEVAERYQVLAAPTVIVNGLYHFYGALREPEFVEQVMRGAQESKRQQG